MGRTPCCEKAHTNKGAWTKEEDRRLISYIRANGEGCWRSLPKAAGLQRCGKSCRLRWINYLRPDLKRGNFTVEEDDTIIKLHASLGNKWSSIAARLPGRTDNEIKNYWNSHIKRKLLRQGIDPKSHGRPHTASSQQEVLVKLENTVKPEITYSSEETVHGGSSKISVVEEEDRYHHGHLNLDLSISLPFYSSESETMAVGRTSALLASTTTEEGEDGEETLIAIPLHRRCLHVLSFGDSEK